MAESGLLVLLAGLRLPPGVSLFFLADPSDAPPPFGEDELLLICLAIFFNLPAGKKGRGEKRGGSGHSLSSVCVCEFVCVRTQGESASNLLRARDSLIYTHYIVYIYVYVYIYIHIYMYIYYRAANRYIYRYVYVYVYMYRDV